MDRKRLCEVRGLVSLLPLLLAFSGCASGMTNAGRPNDGSKATQRPVRAIVTFQKPTADNPRLSATISGACHCSPIFVRPFLSHALIYQISLPQDRPFAEFEKALLSGGAALGVVGVEQDRLEHY